MLLELRNPVRPLMNFQILSAKFHSPLELAFFEREISRRVSHCREMCPRLWRMARSTFSLDKDAFLLCIRQAPLFSAAFRMLAEIARLYRRDAAEQAVYQVKVLETRRRLAELRKHKAAE